MQTRQHMSAPAMVAGASKTLSTTHTRVLVRTLQLGLMLSAAILLVASIGYTYWHLVLHAPQYPRGLWIDVWVNKMGPERNVFEVDGLNHYIGMIKLTEAAKLERDISVFAIWAMSVIGVVSFFLKSRWRWIVRAPMILYPVVFVADLYGWLYYAGHSLDKHAPMSSSIDEFTPTIYGTGTIGQFRTEASFETGFFLALAAALIALSVTIWEWWGRHAENR